MDKNVKDGIELRKGVYNYLSLPFDYKGTKVENFAPRELTLKEMKSLGKIQYKANHPFGWIAKACCLSIEEMGGVKVYDEYISSGKMPEIVKMIPMVSTNNVLVAGHIETLGEHLENIKAICPSCGSSNEAEIDLLSLEVPFLKEDTFETKIFKVDLSKGYTTSVKSQDEQGLSACYTRLFFRLPVLQDLLNLEDSFTESKDLNEFFEELMGQCILKMESDSGEDMPDNFLKMRKSRVLASLSPKDWKKTRVVYNENVPELSVSASKLCTECGSKIEYKMEQNFLFQ